MIVAFFYATDVDSIGATSGMQMIPAASALAGVGRRSGAASALAGVGRRSGAQLTGLWRQDRGSPGHSSETMRDGDDVFSGDGLSPATVGGAKWGRRKALRSAMGERDIFGFFSCARTRTQRLLFPR